MAVKEIGIDLPAEEFAKLQESGVLKDGFIEAVTRGKHKRLDTFFHVAVNASKQSELQEKAGEIMGLLNKNHAESIKMLGNITKLSQFTMVLSGVNLCATAAGFAIMNAKLNKMSVKIDEVIRLQKGAMEIETGYKINKVLSAHSAMLDGRRTKKYAKEEDMRALVSDEYAMLDLLIKVFKKDVTNNTEEIMFYILSMASMLAASMKYFDEIYYFNNREAIGSGEIWYIDHDKWMGIFDTLVTKDILEKIQDYGFFDLDLNTIENDCFYKSFMNQVLNLKQEVEDNQLLIESLDDPELFGSVRSAISESARKDIETTLRDVGIDPKTCEADIRTAVA